MSSPLRDKAEEKLEAFAAGESGASRIATEKLLHELQVHQIELQLQNEELRLTQLALEGARDRYADRYAELYDFAPVGFFTPNDDGFIAEANQSAARLLGVARDKLLRLPFSSFIDASQRASFTAHASRVLQSGEKESCESVLRRHDGSLLPVRLDCVRRKLGREADSPSSVLMAVFDISELKRAESERAAQAERFNELSRRLASVQEIERKRLSGELHDRSSPNLAAIKLNLANFANELPVPLPAPVADLLADTHALIDDTVSSIREICADLRPPVLDYAGLLPALESYAYQFRLRTGITVQVEGHLFHRRPSVEHESLLFRIASEALTNCAKHARATTVRIFLANEGERVRLSISDNGIGFDEAQLVAMEKAPGLGLITMRERAEFAGGSFMLESVPGQGTLIEVRI